VEIKHPAILLSHGNIVAMTDYTSLLKIWPLTANRTIPVVNFQRRIGRFSNEFTPSSPKRISPKIWVRRDGSKIVEKIPSILEKFIAGTALTFNLWEKIGRCCTLDVSFLKNIKISTKRNLWQ
jgi:hypothetical protein